GLAANTAVFTVVYHVLLAPLPYTDSGRLVSITQSNPETGDVHGVSPATCIEWQNLSHTFDGMATVYGGLPAVMVGGERERVFGAFVSPNYFDVLGAPPAIGRGFSPEEGRPESNPVVIISDGFWRRQFGGNLSALGASLEVNGSDYSVIGVMPRGFINARDDYKSPEMWLPAELLGSVTVVARLKPGSSIDQARSDLDGLQPAIEQRDPSAPRGLRTSIIPLREVFVGDLRRPVQLLWGAVGLLLLIVCANVSNLLLARNPGPRKEIAIRTALGASKPRIARSMLTESLVLALLGGGLGVLAAEWATQFAAAIAPPAISRLQGFSIDLRVVGFT